MKKHIVLPGAFFALLLSALPSAIIRCRIRARLSTSHSFLQLCYLCALWATVGWCGVTSTLAQPAPAAVVKVVPSGQDISTSSHQPILVLPANGPASAVLTASGVGFIPTNHLWTQTAPSAVNDQHIHAAQATVTFSATTGAQVTASFPSRGIYQLVLTASNGTTTVSTQVWVHVWDRFTGLNPLQQVGRNPGLLPPSSVRQLSPDPGPYQHPRLLFTDADWPELNAKSTASAEVSGAIARLQTALNNNFDKTSTPVGSLCSYANALTAWADGGFSDSTYTTSVETVRAFSERKQVGAAPYNHLPDALLVASYLVWVRNNPDLAQSDLPVNDQTRFQYLSKVAAAAARAELTRVRLGLAGTATAAPDMAVVYDLLYDWMTSSQRTDLRDYLYTIGYGFYNTGMGGLSRTGPAPSYRANGDFPNLVDPWLLAALVIEGEEESVTPSVVATNTPIAAPSTGPAAWPNASPASVWNLYRMMRWYSEFYVTPWGSPLHHHAYFEASSGMSGPAMLAFARRGQNGFVTTNLYQASFHVFNNLNPESPTTPPVLWDHHDGMGFGNGIGGYAGRYLARYMYPDDALMDYIYPIYRREVNIDFYTALFHIDRPAKTMAQVAAEKGLSRTNFDPFRGAGTTRNTWGENDLSLYFECRPDIQGHMHAEANNFSLYALGRPWCTPPGYHVVINEAAATVLIQDPALASDPGTEGYIGQSPSAATITPNRNQFPTPSGKVLETTEDPAGQWTLFAGDASAAYKFAFEGDTPSTLDTGKRNQDFYYGEVLSHMYSDYNPSADTSTLKVGNLSYNPVAYAYRSVFSARGARPYVLVIDDITVDGSTPRNYRWNMPAFGRTAVNTLRMQAGATATDAVLFHQTDAASGPRLLVRDLSEQSTTGQPAIFLDTRLNGDGKTQLDIGYDNNSGLYTTVQSNRLLITRQNVVSPQFKVLLFPHQSNETLPMTSWNEDKTAVSIDLRNGFTDRLTFDPTHADKRTRIANYTRTLTGREAPILNLPGNLVVQSTPATPAFTGQPGAVVTFAVSATDDTSASLTPNVSSPSGSVFPAGNNTVQITATDALGQITSRSFTITVVPPPPVVTVVSATNQPGFAGAIALRWSPVARATAYSVKRALNPGGPYTVISDRQAASMLDFKETGLTGASYHYLVTSWIDDVEGLPSAEIPLSPPVSTLQPLAIGTGLSASGVYPADTQYQLTAGGGNSGGARDSITYAYQPWTGDGSFTVRVASLSAVGSNVSEFLNLGLSLRASVADNAAAYLSGFTTYPHSSSFMQISRAATGQNSTSSSYDVPPNPKGLRPPVWLRAVRSGTTFSAFFSSDGQTWSPTADPVTLSNFPTSSVIGIALGAQNATVTDAVFDQFVFLGTAVPTIQDSSIKINWLATPGLAFELRRATDLNGPYVSLASNLTTTNYTDTAVTPGTTYHYVIATPGASAGGAGASAPVAVYYPASVTAPTNLVLTPAVGQVSLTWTAADPTSNPTYTVERALASGGPFTVLATGLNSTEYTDSGFNSGVTYIYRVTASNGRSSATSETASASSLPGTFTKANNATALDASTSWSPTTIPGFADTALWTGTYTSGTVSIGTGLAINTLRLSSPSTAITLNADTGSLTLGVGGIDLSASTQNLTVNTPVILADDQIWTIAAGRTLSLTAPVSASSGTRTLTLDGTGTTTFSGINEFIGELIISPPSGGIPTYKFGGNNPSAIARITGGALPAAITANGRLDITAPLSTLGSISGSGASGLITNSSTTSQDITFTGGSSFSMFQVGADNARATLRQSGPGNVSFSFFGYNTAAPNSQHTFVGGNWILNQIGQNNSNSQTSGVFTLTGGADVTVSTQTAFAHGTWKVINGALRFNGAISALHGSSTGTNTSLVFNVNDSGGAPGLLACTGGLTLADGGSMVNANCLTIGSGGTVTLAGNLILGSTTARTAETNTVNLTDGKLVLSGNISAAAATTGQTRTFNWIGGRLTANTITPSMGFATPVSGGISSTTLVQSGGILAPGDLGTAGRMTISGQYTLGSGGTLAVDLGGTTQATAYQTGQYDYLAVSGTTSLAGSLRITILPGFTPTSGQSFTVLNSTGALSGAFANVSFGTRLTSQGGEGSFLVTQVGSTVVLSQYLTSLQSWRQTNFGTTANTGNAANDADLDGDGAPNLLEYALGTTPTSAASRPNLDSQISDQRLQVSFLRTRPDVTYHVEVSTSLAPGSWEIIATNPGSTGQFVTVADSVEITDADPPRRFLRLRVISNTN